MPTAAKQPPVMPLSLPTAASGLAPGIKKLNLNAMPNGNAAIASGEKVIGEGATMQSPRATTEAVLSIRGVATMRARPLIILDARELGMSSLQPAWQARGPLLAVASQNERGLLVQVYDTATRAKIRLHQFGKGAAISCEWDCTGTTLAVTQEGVGIHLWDAGVPAAGVRGGTGPPSPRPLALAHTATANATCATWSRCTEQLAIGTAAGKVTVYNKSSAVVQTSDRKGKHGAPVTCGVWLPDNRLSLASGNRIKLSQPMAPDDVEWHTQVKFKLTGLASRLPKKLKAASAPRLMAFSQGPVPYVAVCVGEAYLLIFSTGADAGVSDDIGLSFPDDYGAVVGFAWDENELLLIGLSNGLVTIVDFPALLASRKQPAAPPAVTSATTRIFQQSLTCLRRAEGKGLTCATGDSGFKILSTVAGGREPQVLADVPLSLPHHLDHRIDSCAWDVPGRRLCICATDGQLWAYEVEDVSGVEPAAGLREASNGRRPAPLPGAPPSSQPVSKPSGDERSRNTSGGQLTAAYRL